MKNTYLLLLTSLLLFSMCSDDKEEITPANLNINQERSEIDITHSTLVAKIMIESNVDWTASIQSEPMYASFDKNEQHYVIQGNNDKEILVYFSENTKQIDREVKIHFSTKENLYKDVTITQRAAPSEIVLYKTSLQTSDEWINPNRAGVFDTNGLKITGTGLENTLLLNRHYSLNKRLIRHHVQFGSDSRMLFLAKETYRHVNMGTITEVDVLAKKLRIYHAFNAQTSVLPVEKASKDIPFDIDPQKSYIIELVRDNKENRLTLIDSETSQRVDLSDTSGATGRQYDFYGLCLYSGSSVHITNTEVAIPYSRPEVIMYGNSITDGMYLPDPNKRYAQLIIDKKFNGNGSISGRGGGNIGDLTNRIKNELPYLMPKYCMISIGTNGGNSVENLSVVIDYIISLGITPILNNIPCAGNGRQIAVNAIIQQVREKYQLEGYQFDLPTSLNNDGLEINYSIYNSDNGAWVHPNEEGHAKMAAIVK